MAEDKKYIAARIPEYLHKGLINKAKPRGLTLTDVLIEAIEQYLGSNIPGLCSSCHHQNAPEAGYCQKCGEPLTDNTIDSLRNQIEELKTELDGRPTTAQMDAKIKDTIADILGANDNFSAISKIINKKSDSKDE